ncbi:small-conductance calcium-activated potassium channel protein [Stylonychia lemnae]|uniref:Small-conductance calcium-activated potassium channel protein n=1 Tax=Stylonychia lemnae TaxID=5949 RepID=A0A078A3V8_STYLE|nr:small-conductance calcium-activated potassium channel protein [Stylonychia lemnae]|eukprot:CDW76554.1 small-conductance calcium-activated potassium channel protein [Stylonychia lemnae]
MNQQNLKKAKTSGKMLNQIDEYQESSRNYNDQDPDIKNGEKKSKRKSNRKSNKVFAAVENSGVTTQKQLTIKQNLNKKRPSQEQNLKDNDVNLEDIFKKDTEDHDEESQNNVQKDLEELFDQDEMETALEAEDAIKDVRLSNQYYNKIIISEYSAVFFSTFGMCLSVLLFEMKDNKDISEVQNMVLSYNVFCTIGCILSIYMRYDLYLLWNKSRGLLTEYDTLWNTGNWQSLGCELFIVIIAPYPFLYDIKYEEYNPQFSTYITYDVNDLLLTFSFLRIYILARFTMVKTQFMNPRSLRVCLMNGCQADVFFAVKSIMKQRPYTVLGISMIISTVIFSYQLKIFEAPMSEISGQNFQSFINCMWCVMVTMGTIGYGDIYPKTVMGRIIGMIVCFWGVFIVSIFVVTLNNMLTFSANEEKAYNLLQRLYYKGELKRKATLVLGSAFRQRNVKINDAENNRKILTAMRIFRMHMISFQNTARAVRGFYEADTDVEIMQKLIENLMEDVKMLRENQLSIQKRIYNVGLYIEKQLQQHSFSNQSQVQEEVEFVEELLV